jgi:enediyne biosynthesis protein E4
VKLLKVVLLIFLVGIANVASAGRYIDDIIAEIKALESERDPKCYATASRLEDFMFGTPLSDQARFSKNKLQSDWVKLIWMQASKIAKQQGYTSISAELIEQVINRQFAIAQTPELHWKINFSDGNTVVINQTDKRQYSTIAYSLRAVLAVQQESLLDFDIELLPLKKQALTHLTSHLDGLNLAVLKISDQQARKNSQREINQQQLIKVWTAVLDMEPKFAQSSNNSNTKKNQVKNNRASPKAKSERKNTSVDLQLVKNIIQQKIASYKTYNELSSKLFNRNLQIYFARMNLTKDEKKQKAFSKLFNETMIQFAFDVYKESEKIALANGHKTIQESDVNQLIQQFIPHQVDEFEDTLFFTSLAKNEHLVIESYDADSFRDNSAHWRILLNAISSSHLNPTLQPDPFALELIAENIALFGVLTLKVSGIIGKQKNAKYLQPEHYRQGLIWLSQKLEKQRQAKTKHQTNNQIYSQHDTNQPLIDTPEKKLFSDVTQKLGANVQHRTSDWLSRLLRSYLQKSENIGVVFVPPAFGGAGVAAEDLNNDGFIDLLYLSGRGNYLLKNEQGIHFKDVTSKSGLLWMRKQDNLPGEPRQPIIADFDNDGLADIFVSYAGDQHRIYKNLGNFVFKDMTETASLGGDGLMGGPATAADFDNDGLLDLYITYFGPFTKGILPTLKRNNNNASPNQLFKNVGGFKFKNVTANSGVDNRGWSQAVSHSDFDGDGDQDIILGNDFGINAYYRNDGSFKFTDVAKQLGTDKASYSMNIGIADLNQDLLPDFYISNIVIMNKDEKYVMPNEDTPMKFDSNKLANMRVIEANDLFLSDSGSGKQTYQLSDGVGRGYSATGWSWGADFFDFDNDTDNDLYLLNGMNEYNLYTSDNPYFTDSSMQKRNVYIPVAEKESNLLFVNQNGKLNNVSESSGVDFLGNSRSAAYLDFDNDGDLDIAVNNFNEPAHLFRNNLEPDKSRWLAIKLVGTPDKGVNRDAIGAQIILVTNSGKRLWREVHSSVGYMAGHPKIQYFGLGDEQIKHVQIHWPNGEELLLDNLSINQRHQIIQQ